MFARSYLVALMVLSVFLTGCQDDAQMGRIVVADAGLESTPGGSRLRATVDYDFSAQMLEALHHGVPLTVLWDLELRRQRGALWDATQRHIQQAATLSFHSLSERYVVTYSATGRTRAFPTLQSALEVLGAIDEPIYLDIQADEGQQYLRLRARLDLASLPAPLQLPALLSAEWRTHSPWFQWPVAHSPT